jgi:hypothetical protein
MTRNKTEEFVAAWLGECGAAPALAASLPVTNICPAAALAAGKAPPSSAPAGAGGAPPPAAAPPPRCLHSREVAAGVPVELRAATTCGAAKGTRVTYRGSRCGPKGSLIRWTSYTVIGAAGAPESCARAPTALQAQKAAAAEGRVPGFGNYEVVGACGVPPMIHRALPTEVCAHGAAERAEGPAGLPQPKTALATGAARARGRARGEARAPEGARLPSIEPYCSLAPAAPHCITIPRPVRQTSSPPSSPLQTPPNPSKPPPNPPAPPTEELSKKEELPWGIPRIEAVASGNVTKPLPVVVGVVDTGIDEGHPDLVVAGGMSWVGSSYRDQNGHGAPGRRQGGWMGAALGGRCLGGAAARRRHKLPPSARRALAQPPPQPSRPSPLLPALPHLPGTHVAGTIGALNNGGGVIGVDPGTPIFALRVLDARGSGSFSNIINALLWVAQNGAAKGIRVINMSLGGDGGSNPTESAVCGAIADVLDAGIAVVAAAGNAGGGYGPRSWTGQLPAACPGVIAVTAIDSANNPATFSYFLGPAESKEPDLRQRTVAAPGVDVKSTWPRDLGQDYRSISGTSMAWWVWG